MHACHILYKRKSWLELKNHKFLKGDGGTNNGKNLLTMIQLLEHVYHTLWNDGHHGQVL